MTASNCSSVFKIIHIKLCTPKERSCWMICLGFRHVSLPLCTETRAQPEGQLPLVESPSLTWPPRLAPESHSNRMPCKHPAVFAVSGQPQHSRRSLSCPFACYSFVLFLFLLLPKLQFLLAISLSPSLSPAAEFLLGLGQSHPNTIP